MNTPISELNVLTESEKQYRCRERLEDFHLTNMDYKAALMDKWAMVMLYQTKGAN